MNFFLDYHSRIPIYEQIKEQVIIAINNGEVKKDDQLPSLRQLSSELSVNINTIKRAFSELENQGIAYSIAGKGFFVSGRAKDESFYKSSMQEIESAVKTAKALGVSQAEIIKSIETIYKGEN